MNGWTAAFAAQLIAAVIGVAVAVAVPTPRLRARLAGTSMALLGASGCVAGVGGLASWGGRIGIDLPLGDLALGWQPTPLGGVFTLLAGVVTILAAVYGTSYAHGPTGSRTAWAALIGFALAMHVLPASADVVSFLTAWETMAVGSTILVGADQAARASVRPAAVWYGAMTHLSFLLVCAGLLILAAAAGTLDFAGIAAARLTGPAASWGFALAVVGFATKAGAVPLHVWLPRAHPEAPSHVSALMSGVMVKLGIFGILLLTTALLPPGPPWWALLVLGLGLPSALYGILQASVANDLKRLLAYSTTENVGLILIAIAVAMLTAGTRPGVSATALVAALLLTVSHAAFKTTLFLVAGAVLQAGGERDLDRMGGLALRMPVTMTAFALGTLGAAALPITSGFVAEWTLLQALIHADAHNDRLTSALLPMIMGVVALTAGLALLTFAKAFGIAALARPRTPSVAAARECAPAMQVAQVLAALWVVGMGLFPGPVAQLLSGALPPGAVAVTASAGLRLPEIQASLDPLALALLALGVSLPVLVVGGVLARRVPRDHVELGWGCGGVRTSPRMQYTATSYAEPLVRVFDDALSPTRDVTINHTQESRYAVRSIAFSQHVRDLIEWRMYRPAVTAVLRAGDRARSIQNGSLHRYVGFSLAALLLVLIGVLP